jgi:hypothetical protein
MWRIGSQTPPSRMMMPWVVVPTVGLIGAEEMGPKDGVAAIAGVALSAAATTMEAARMRGVRTAESFRGVWVVNL